MSSSAQNALDRGGYLLHVNGFQKIKHILIVDDDSSVLKLLKGYLAERYDVATAINGKAVPSFPIIPQWSAQVFERKWGVGKK